MAPKLDLESLQKSRAGQKGWLTRTEGTLLKLIDETPLNTAKLKVEYANYSGRVVKLRALQQDIESLLDDEAAIITEIAAQGGYDDHCSDILAKIEPYLSSSNTTATNQPGPAAVNPSLWPKVTLKKFSGKDLTLWLPFLQGFSNSIDRVATIPDHMKLTVLVNHLEDDALACISCFAQVDENYKPAFTLLKKKFGDEDKLVEAYVDKLLELQSKSSQLTIRQLYDQLLSIVCMLETLNVKREMYAILLVPLMRATLSTSLKIAFAKYERDIKIASNAAGLLLAPQKVNRLTIFLDFLQQEAEIIESVHEEAKPISSPPATSETTDSSRQSVPSHDSSSRQRHGKKSPTANFHLKSGDANPNKSQKKKNPNLGISLPPCPFCTGNRSNHHPGYCKNGAKFSCSEVKLLMKRDSRCNLCFGLHPESECTTNIICILCGQKHNALVCSRRTDSSMLVETTPQTTPGTSTHLLHLAVDENKNSSGNISSTENATTDQSTASTSTTLHEQSDWPASAILLQTATVLVRPSSTLLYARIILDCGSQRTYVTTDFVTHTQAKIVRYIYLDREAFGGIRTPPRRYPVVELVLISRHSSSHKIKLEAIVTDCITNSKFASFDCSLLPKYPYLQNLQLADGTEFSDMPITLLVGLDFYWEILGTDVRKGPDSHTPVGLSSLFGWVVSGKVPDNYLSQSNNVYLNLNIEKPPKSRRPVSKADLDKLLRAFWELEQMGITEKEMLSNNDLAMKLFLSTIFYMNGRYHTGLTWKPDHPPLVSNYLTAVIKLKRLMKRLAAKPKIFAAYHAAIQEFLDSDYIEEVPADDASSFLEHCEPLFESICLLSDIEIESILSESMFQLAANSSNLPVDEYYMPHRPNIKESSSTYKVRPVYNASEADENGNSLNDCLLPGPSLCPDILDIILRWMGFPVAFIGDIRRAFLQIGIVLSDRDVLRFLWNNKIFRFTRVPFGVCCSPFLLNATIRYHLTLYAESNSDKSELCTDIDHSMYVDDYCSGASSIEAAHDKILSSIQILSEAGMDLRSWNTSSQELGEMLKTSNIHQDDAVVCKVLGIMWDTRNDELFCRSVVWEENNTPTKRSVASFVSSVFDILGILLPITVRGKILMQRIWKTKLPWDRTITDTGILDELYIVIAEFAKLDQIRIRRFYFTTPDELPISLHLFCDASQDAYASCVYLVSESSTRLVVAKSRVAPIQTPIGKIPCLELMACLIGAILINRVRQELNITQSIPAYCWTDSTVALAWVLSSEDVNEKRKVFIRNRVRKIHELTKDMTWGWICSGDNSSDLATRPNCTVESLISNQLWWHGPSWLLQSRDFWPKPPPSIFPELQPIPEVEIQPEVELVPETVVYLAVPVDTDSNVPIFDISSRSRLSTLLKITSYIFRYAYKSDVLPHGNGVLATSVNLRVSTPSKEEIDRALTYWLKLAQHEHFQFEIASLENSSQCSAKSKFFRLRPKLDSAGILRTLGRTHRVTNVEPILLPTKSHLTTLIVMNFHEKYFHCGVSQTLAELQPYYWIPKGRLSVKRILNECMICYRHKVLPYLQLPSALPEFRISEKSPFVQAGIDFAGPFKLIKGIVYVLLITCCCTRALHCEVTNDATAPSVLNALSRCKSRRMIDDYELIVSDNAKAFLKARKLLDVKWIPIPERSPWWGGFWERLVKSIKSAMRINLGRARLSFEEFRTVIPEFEAVINRRPLTYVSESLDDPAPLRPVDLLISPGPPPSLVTTSDHEKLNGRLKHQHHVARKVSRRWRTEYLNSLHAWTLKEHGKFTPNVGDVVLVDPLNVKNRALFPLGLITEIISGRDGHTRVVYVRVNGKILRRTTKHLYPLEIAKPSAKLATSADDVTNSTGDVTKSQSANDVVGYSDDVTPTPPAVVTGSSGDTVPVVKDVTGSSGDTPVPVADAVTGSSGDVINTTKSDKTVPQPTAVTRYGRKIYKPK